MTTNGPHKPTYTSGWGARGDNIAEGGLYRMALGGEWQPAEKGLPPQPQVRALLVHPDNPSVLYAGAQQGVYRSGDRGEHWEALESPRDGQDVWSLAFHPSDPDVIFAGYEPCSIYRTLDGGETWRQMNTERIHYPNVTTYMQPLAKRVIGIAADPSDPSDVYAAVEVGGLLASRDGGESWDSITDGLYVRNNTVDLHGVQVSAAAPGVIYIITQVAMFRSRDRGGRWEHVRFGEMFPGRLVLPRADSRSRRSPHHVPRRRCGWWRSAAGHSGGRRAVPQPRRGRDVGAHQHWRHAAEPNVPDRHRPGRALQRVLLRGIRPVLRQRRRGPELDGQRDPRRDVAQPARVPDG